MVLKINLIAEKFPIWYVFLLLASQFEKNLISHKFHFFFQFVIFEELLGITSSWELEFKNVKVFEILFCSPKNDRIDRGSILRNITFSFSCTSNISFFLDSLSVNSDIRKLHWGFRVFTVVKENTTFTLKT